MRIFGIDVTFSRREKELAPVRSYTDLFGAIRESFPGAWQRNIVAESRENILRFSAVYACVTRIANDIAKLRMKLIALDRDGIWSEVDYSSPFYPVIRKPNRYETRIQFFKHWMFSKLLSGNTYVLKERDARGMVVALYILDPERVTPLIADDGSVYYRLGTDNLAGLDEATNGGKQITVPASEIIHDRMNAIWHPLVGVSPIYACAATATQGTRIQANSERFFGNMSSPGGQLTAPDTIDDVTAARIKAEFERNFGGSNIGRLFVAGDGLKFEPITIPAQDAQLMEQQKWTVEDVARAFHIPLHKIGAGPSPSFNNIGSLNQDYFNETLHDQLEDIELLVDEGFALPSYLGVEFDTDILLRMDPLSRADASSKLVGGGIMSPNEARLKENLPPVPGGGSPYLQQQNYSLAALAKRDAKEDPFKSAPAPTPPPPPNADGSGDGATPPGDGKPPPPAADDTAKFYAKFRERLLERCTEEVPSDANA
jgi:HK97 family phage portal protein